MATMDDNDLASIHMVSGVDPFEPIGIQFFEPLGIKTLVEGLWLQSLQVMKPRVVPDVLASLAKIQGRERSISKAFNCFFLSELKTEMIEWGDKPLFKQRHHRKTVGYELTPEDETPHFRGDRLCSLKAQ